MGEKKVYCCTYNSGLDSGTQTYCPVCPVEKCPVAPSVFWETFKKTVGTQRIHKVIKEKNRLGELGNRFEYHYFCLCHPDPRQV